MREVNVKELEICCFQFSYLFHNLLDVPNNSTNLADFCVVYFSIKARFIRRISAVSNAIETIDNEMICFIIYCLNCIRHGRNATYEPDLIHVSERTPFLIRCE